jgi:hypothetical protein
MFRSARAPIESGVKPAETGGRMTLLLGLLSVGCLGLLVFSLLRLESVRYSSWSAQRDLQVCRQDLSDLAKWGPVRTSGTPASASDPALNRRLGAAAVAAGISGELASVEPNQPVRVRDTDYLETPVYVRLSAVTLRQVVIFVSDLSTGDAAVRAKTIELSPPAGQPKPQNAAELWTTDIGLAYQNYSPRGRESR